jgi:uroporphyrinogen decarboxylase
MTLTPRQRILTTLDHREPDRQPLALWGSWYGVTDKLYLATLEELGWEPVPPFRPEFTHSVNYYDDRLLERLGTDIRHVDPGSTAITARLSHDGSDAWGLKYRRRGLYRAAASFPLENATVEEILEWEVPRADEVIDEEAILERLQAIRNLGDEYAVAGRAVASYGLFEMAQSMRRHDQLLADILIEPENVHALVGRLAECYTSLIGRFLEIAGDALDIIELPGDDYAGNTHPIISPEHFDEFFLQPYTRMIAEIKRRAPQIKVAFHSDGAVAPFLERWIAMGVEIFHPLEPLPATDMAAIKAQYGDRLVLLGAIDIRTEMQGSLDGVEAEAQRRMELLSPGGGYILAPANHLQSDVPPENLLRLYDYAREHTPYA